MKVKLLAALSAAFGIAALANGPEARASSLDGAGRIVVLPYAVSGLVRESTIYVTNPSLREIRVFSMYVGAEGTPLAASAHGLTPCKEIQVRPGETSVIPLRTLCGLGTPDVENFGYVQFATYFGFDGAPFLVSSTIDAGSSSLFGVEGVPAGAIEPSQSALVRQDALRVVGLTGEVPSGTTIAEKLAHCYIGALGEPKKVTVQLMEYSSGTAKPLGNPIQESLAAFTMVKLANVFARAGLRQGSFSNVTAEFWADQVGNGQPPTADGAALIAACSVETVAAKSEDFRLARTPNPRDASRSRNAARGDTRFDIGPFQIGYLMKLGDKARMTFYQRHEDWMRCWLEPSVVTPNDDTPAYQELQVIDPNGRVLPLGDNVSDTGPFFTGVKNESGPGVNGRWTLEVSWQESSPGVQVVPPFSPGSFAVSCRSSSGLSALLPASLGVDDF